MFLLLGIVYFRRTKVPYSHFAGGTDAKINSSPLTPFVNHDRILNMSKHSTMLALHKFKSIVN